MISVRIILQVIYVFFPTKNESFEERDHRLSFDYL